MPQAAAAAGTPIVLVGPADLADRVDIGDLPLIVASEIIEMDEDGGKAIRRKKDSTLVRAAEAVRDGRASAMISAGNTGATMASALLRMGRIKGVKRPAIATIIPVPDGQPTVLLDAGANAEVQAEWMVQFAQMGSIFSRHRFGVESPKVGLLSIGEEPGKGDQLRKETYPLLVEAADASDLNFIGNVEGRDVMTDLADVIVADGFTGNVMLKTLEGGLKVGDRRPARGVRFDARVPATRRCPDAGAAAALRDARPRDVWRRDAARRRWGVHHLARLVERASDRECDPGRPGDGRGRRGRRDLGGDPPTRRRLISAGTVTVSPAG